MLKIGFEPQKIFMFSKNTFLPVIVLGLFLVYFFSVAEFSEETYRSVHLLFLIICVMTAMAAVFFKIPYFGLSAAVIYLSYLIINNTRYVYGEDYMFSSAYNIWIILLWPNLLLAYLLYLKPKTYRYWSLYFIGLFAETAIIERLLNQSIDADSYYFYKHIGMFNYPALCTAIICFFVLTIRQIAQGRILNAIVLFSSIAVMIGIFLSDNLFAFGLFFLAAVLINFVSLIFYVFYTKYRDEELNMPNMQSFCRDAEKKYPLKYSIVLMYIDEYERILKRFGMAKTRTLKKMFLARIHKEKPNVLIYNYRPEALILAFMNANANESFEQAEEIRRMLAKSIFVFNESNHLQLTVSQCVSEKKRSDADAAAVLERAEDNLRKACKFTRNITIKA
ncbi:MAG: hypothetical protein IJ864_05005 [Alphaproteobacteria bacterium]|nr:hypothetical protein [Alphaproteobacteria bacterium]